MTENDNLSPNHQPDESADPLVSVRAILLADVRGRLHSIEDRIETSHLDSQSAIEDLQQQLDNLLADLDRAQALAHEADDRSRDINTEIEILKRKAQADAEGLIARITPVMGDMIGRSIRDSKDDMAEALGPIMGEAIRVQIRDSRKDMVEAIYPIIGETVQKAVSEFAKEFQRNIDARLKASFGPQGIMRRMGARLRGVSSSELALRDSLPFSIQEIFIIQHGSGLLIAHSHPGSHEVADSDLIGAMLTAIRDFVHDSFSHGQEDQELAEVQYGENRIIIQSGRTAYLAVVITGVEPEGFRSYLREFISELHVKYEASFRQYTGDPSTLPNLQPKIARLVEATTGGTGKTGPLSGRAKLNLALSILLLILLAMLACFYLRFTIALYPVAFPSPTPTSTPTATNTPTATATATATSTATATATFTPTGTATPTFTFTPTATPTPYKAFASGHVWMRQHPDSDDQRVEVLFLNTPVTVLSVYGSWMEVEWVDEKGYHYGWVPLRWITLLDTISPGQITPTQTP